MRNPLVRFAMLSPAESADPVESTNIFSCARKLSKDHDDEIEINLNFRADTNRSTFP